MIPKQEVIKIAKLARLKLTEEETFKMQKDLSAILEYFNLLKKAKPRSVPIKSWTTTGAKPRREKKRTRDDTAVPQPKSVVKKLIESAPDRKGDHIKVKSIL